MPPLALQLGQLIDKPVAPDGGPQSGQVAVGASVIMTLYMVPLPVFVTVPPKKY